MVDSLLSLAYLDNVSSDPRKCLREGEIRKSEERVTKLMQVMKENFINPFNANIDQQKLFNLASGWPLSEEASNSLLSAEEREQVRYEQFNQRLNVDDESRIARLKGPLQPKIFISEHDVIRPPENESVIIFFISLTVL